MSSARALAQAFAEAHPEGAARLLERIDPLECAGFLGDLPVETSVALLRGMMPGSAGSCLERLGEARAAELIGALDPLDARSILMRLPANRRSAILARLPRESASALLRLLEYPEDTVGAWVDALVPSIVETASVGDALDALMRMAGHEGGAMWLLSANRHLRGYVPVSRLLIEDPATVLARLEARTAPALSTRASLGSIAAHEGWTSHDTLPVVDRQQRFVGVVHNGLLAKLALGVGHLPGESGPGAAMTDLLGAYWTGFSMLLEAVLPGHAGPASGPGKGGADG